VCRSSTGICDPQEVCDGTNGTCPADVKSASGTVCRSSTGVCDPQEVCDGQSSTCPADVKSASGTVCRSSTGICDPQEVCDGTSSNCPADVKSPSGTVCRSSNGVCDLPEVCDGTSSLCPPDTFKPTSVVCRTAAGECDMPENCPGNGPNCPSDAKKPFPTPCTDDGNVCTLDQCDGQTNTCTHPPGNTGTVCRSAAGQCDMPELCNGTSTPCPPDTFKPAGTSCDADHDVCTIDQCDANGMCKVVAPSDDPSCTDCNELLAGPPCSVTVSGLAMVFSSVQAAVDAAPNGTTVTPRVITVSGVCVGSTRVISRQNLIIQGDLTPETCPPGRNELHSTLAGPSTAEIIKMTSCKNVVVRYLNIVHGDLAGHDAVEYKKSTNGGPDCNCIALNDDEGIQVHAGKQVLVTGNRVTRNRGAGIDIADTTTMDTIYNNLSLRNGTHGILISGSTGNTYMGNICTMNSGSGFDLQSADSNMINNNTVTNNTVAGITLEASPTTPANGSDKNNVDMNTINSNGDALVNKLRCILGMMNIGSNATGTTCQ
jgi:parallel beta-helix repeat protein